MFLYDRKDNTIEIYAAKKNENGLKEFRIKEMQKIDEHNRVLDCHAYHVEMGSHERYALFWQWATQRLPEEVLDKTIISSSSIKVDRTTDEDAYYYSNVLRSAFNSDEELIDAELISYGQILSPEQLEFKRKLYNSRYFETLQQYYDGQFSDKLVARIQYLKTIRYFLLTNPNYMKSTVQASHFGPYFNFVMGNIIELPESLYLLQLLEQEKLGLLVGKDISSQLAFYSITKLDERSLEDFRKMDLCGITQNGYSHAVSKAATDAYVLSLLKK